MSSRNLVPAVVFGFLVLGIPATAGVLWMRSQPVSAPPILGSPEVRDVVVKTVATGSVVPRNEVAIKPRVSGILSRLYVEPGDTVEAGQLMADIRVIPDSARLAAARALVTEAQIRLADAQRERDQIAALVDNGAAGRGELDDVLTRVSLAEQALSAAQTDLAIVRDGAARSMGEVSTSVTATVPGMVLTVPIKEGASVIEANTFNEGTTVAEVADMSDLLFIGFIDEAEVGRVSEGMPLSVTLAAWPDTRLPGTLEHIAPKGVDVSGAIQFEIRAALDLSATEGRFVRANMSANADMVLDQRTQVLAVSEAFLLSDVSAPTVRVQVGDGFEDRPVELGLSDGIHAEVRSGITADDVLVRPEGSAGRR